jgi:hypothetical protein
MSKAVGFAVSILVTAAGASLALAQGPRPGQQCDDGWSGGRRDTSICEVRELILPASASLSIDGGGNGGVRVKGWDRDEISVRAQVRVWGRNEDAVRASLEQITIETAGTLRARGPQGRNGSWNVLFEIMAPRETGLDIETVNGGIAITDMRGDVDFEAVNGGVALDNVSANVHGHTVNGGLSIEFEDDSIDGDEFDVRTTNGGAALVLPEDFSARLDIRTVNGGIHVNFPVTAEGRVNRELSTTLGQGGPLLRVRTTNGGVTITRN